ncbi:uncharacterized protein LOC112502581 isoform X1 [Cynara cardunculus var. scolymus]|uniref:uncharacterized protein LOC112502581 isoform X1 n=2 Tax=Cynara cardunculus var. scolymus TaxID=59895 RepID=UPI000D625EC8|nr:uncharacterized protein LOC112502581 isoform X1 [Cynara cardunculus var. scolymus]
MRFMRMEKLGVLHLEVGQLAEMRTFVRGFRGAWFRCKIKDVFLEKNKILLEYYDFSDEEISWAKIYEVPHYGRKSKQIKKQLMMRPHYPQMHHTSEMPPVNSISEVCVINDGTWKVGDLVDWFEDSSYWSARVIKVLSDDKVKIELPMAPAGEGGVHEAFCKDLRPSLDWSAGKGWTLATMEGQSSCSAQLIFPSQQDEVNCLDSEREEASSTSRISAAIAIEGGDRERQQEANKMNSEQVKMDGKAVISSSSSSSEDSISTLHVEESKEEEVVVGSAEYSSSIELNMMHEETLEATILDLEELANRIKWIKSILETNQDTSSLSSSSRWKFT